MIELSLDFFRQTNRTILFEELNPEKLDLLTLIETSEDITSLSDEKIKEINEKLLVKNFNEFLTKFEPKIYSFFNAASQKIRYSLEKPEGIPDEHITEIPLNMENTFFKMLSSLMDTKKVVGDKNVDFNFNDILSMLSPKSVMDDIKQLRKEIAYLYDKHESLEDEDPKKLEYADKLNIAFDKASKNYNNVLGMLPLAIEDIKTRILITGGDNTKKSEKIKLGLLSMNDKGELKIIENKEKKEKSLMIADSSNIGSLVKYFEEDYEAVTEEPNDYIKKLVVRTFAPLPTVLEEINYDQEVKNHNHYLEFYKEAQEDFIKVAKPLMEKMLGIKMFFEQYDQEVKGMQPTLLITNLKLEMLLKGENKNKLSIYLNTVNNKNDFENTVWFGIVPNVILESQANIKNIRERFKGTNKIVTNKGNTLENLQVLMELVSKYKIQIFFSVNANDETTFNNLAMSGVEKYVEKTRSLQYKDFSEFIVPCIPNFTVIPKEKSSVVLDYKLKIENSNIPEQDKENLIKFWIEGVYIESSYIAAGLTAAYQCPEILRKKYKKVLPKEPGVRINIEDKDNSLKLFTNLSKEISGYTIATKDSINRNNFGYVFSSDNVQLNGKPINNITVYKARTLATNQDGIFEPLYKTLTTTYIERILRFLTIDFKEDKIKDFFSNRPDSQKNIWLKGQEAINGILQPGDDISIEIDGNSCHLHISYNGDVKNLVLDITKK